MKGKLTSREIANKALSLVDVYGMVSTCFVAVALREHLERVAFVMRSLHKQERLERVTRTLDSAYTESYNVKWRRGTKRWPS